MKKILLLGSAFFFILPAYSQKGNPKKYPSLFWEITGNGISRPSYLFGTMHVSSKMVFHLPDSFYFAIKSADVVALETNPESWQEDLVKYDLSDNSSNDNLRRPVRNFRQLPDDYLNIRTLQFDKYEKQIEAALYSRPSTINNLLYRNYSEYSSDFEENTYLDMYIYQVGKKMNKRVAGVEKYEESMKLMMEAYRDAAKERYHKQKSYDNDDNYSADKLQEAYRTGNLDLLDSINRLNSFSDAFDEKFLYSRNLLQANSIDSILKTRSSLFVGVGAAHLPGSRGVIEILRRMGYKLRPIMMGERDSNQKDAVEKLRVPVAFSTQTSEDGFFKVDIPGKFYRFAEDGLLDQLQYADMANGSYYMATRIKTNSQLWGNGEETVKRKIDSLLYENIPGKILSKQEILRNGYHGIDIINRTRRGDVQRYNIFITPYEVIIFKMSGNGDYVKDGDESKRFFGSIQLKEYKNINEWKSYQPAYGGFRVELPQEPFVSKNVSWQYDAEDKSTGTSYTILRTDIHNYGFAEEDTFDLDLMSESFAHSGFIDKELSRKLNVWKGYPALDCKYLHKNGSILLTRFIIQGPHYYTLIAHSKNENAGVEKFFNSFEIKPFVYRSIIEKKDTSLFYTVKTTFYPESKKIKLTIPGGEDYSSYNSGDDDDDDSNAENNFLYWGNFKNGLIEDDSTGEKIYVSFYKNGRYYYNSDSSQSDENKITRSESWILRSKKKYKNTENWKVVEYQLSDTNSSRMIWTKTFYKNGVRFFLATEIDTLTEVSSFVKNFFQTFTPDDSLKGFNPFEKKSDLFFADLFSSDSLLHKQAVRAIDEVKLDSADLPNLKKAIENVNWSEKKYLDVKKSLVSKMADLNTKESSDLLKQLYYAAEDTIELQYAALETLLQQQTQYAENVFRDIIIAEPPVLETNPGNYYANNYSHSRFSFSISAGSWGKNNYSNENFWDDLYDSIQLVRNILPDMLPLVNVDDYKWKMMALLGRMIDSDLVAASDYEMYFNKFFIEAKQEYKKQIIAEKQKQIKQASEKNLKTDEGDDTETNDYGNEKLQLYEKLLLPFWKINAGVPVFFKQLLETNDKRLKYNTMLLLLRNGRSVADSTLNYFAALDDYRYTLYNDLEECDQLSLFPKQYNNQVTLAKSKLINTKSYNKPDSVLYLDKLPAAINSRQGLVYFFKYKEKKDDPVWKLATVGLLSKDTTQFEIRDASWSINDDPNTEGSYDDYDFTSFTETKITENEPVSSQLSRQLKRTLYSRRKSAKEFYDVSKNSLDGFSSLRLRN